jgi:hypothetical protein
VWIDALAVNPWEKTFYLGEVTYNPKPTPLARKVNLFYERKPEVIKQLSLEGLSDGWAVRPWLFIRQEAVPYLLPRLPAGQYPRITYLEETAFPWKYEAVRKQGKEPGKPHGDFDQRLQD